MSATTAPPTYPISAATARALERPLFGHVIDGEVVPSLRRRDHAGDRPGDGRAGRHRGGRRPRADVDRAVRSARAAFDDGRWRVPGAARAGAAAAQASPR